MCLTPLDCVKANLSSLNFKMEEDQFRRCQFLIKQKNRFCRMLTKPGMKYCGEHAYADQTLIRPRIPCPLDQKHSIYEDYLKRHLKKCNSRVRIAEPWCVENINAVSITDGAGSSAGNFKRKALSELPWSDVNKLISVVKKAHSAIPVPESINIAHHPLFDDQLSDSLLSVGTKKHIHQAAVLISLMEKLKILQNDTCFVEFGAGKARLSYLIYHAVKDLAGCSYVLIDKAGSRGKFENRALKTNPLLNFVRIRSAIEHVDLSKIEAIRSAKHVVAVWKHLCGGATDIALRAISRMVTSNSDINLSAIFAVPCCHHQCSWSTYLARGYLLKHGIANENEFQYVTAMSSWATCGFRSKADELHLCIDNETEMDAASTMDVDLATGDISFGNKEKEDIGFMCKDILNYGRAVSFTEATGINLFYAIFVSSDVTPENRLLYGFKQ